jgi:hypothetical protein
MRIWEQQRRNRSLVSEYAEDSVEEGFAEAFAHLLRKPERLHRRDPLSEAFLNDLLPPQELSSRAPTKHRS